MANSFDTRWKFPLFLLAALLAGCATQGPARVSVSGYSVSGFTAVP